MSRSQKRLEAERDMWMKAANDLSAQKAEMMVEFVTEIERLRAELDASGCDYCSIPNG